MDPQQNQLPIPDNVVRVHVNPDANSEQPQPQPQPQLQSAPVASVVVVHDEVPAAPAVPAPMFSKTSLLASAKPSLRALMLAAQTGMLALAAPVDSRPKFFQNSPANAGRAPRCCHKVQPWLYFMWTGGQVLGTRVTYFHSVTLVPRSLRAVLDQRAERGHAATRPGLLPVQAHGRAHSRSSACSAIPCPLALGITPSRATPSMSARLVAPALAWCVRRTVLSDSLSGVSA